jgi:hypothetical protein
VGKSVVDGRGARIVGISEFDAGRQGGRHDVAVTVQPAVAAVVGALLQRFRHACPAQAVLAHRGGVGTGPVELATGGVAFVVQGCDEHAGSSILKGQL